MTDGDGALAATAARDGSLLNGRLRYRQLESGHRTGLEPVLLAAAVPARAGESVIEAGTGAGAGLLCLYARVAGVRGTGLEIRPELAALARENATANGCADLDIHCADLAAWRSPARFDHAMANPPWHDPRGTCPDDGLRQTARFADAQCLPMWVSALSRLLRHRGTLTLVAPAAQTGRAAAALEATGCGEMALFPLWPRAGVAARLVLLRGVKNGKGGSTVLPGLVLHDDDGTLSAAAQRVLRGGEKLSM